MREQDGERVAGRKPLRPRAVTAGRQVCVYAIVDVRSLPVLAGCRGERLRLSRAGRLAAVVGDIARALSPTAPALRRYHAAIAALADAVPALLPARFGTVMSEEELAFVLRARAAAFATMLATVRGRVQMTIRLAEASRPPRAPRVDADESRRGGDPTGCMRNESASTTTGSGVEYLRERAATVAREREVEGFAPVRAALARFVRAEAVERRAGVASVYHLVPRHAAARYTRAAHTAAGAAGLPLAVSGPFPPYAFTAF